MPPQKIRQNDFLVKRGHWGIFVTRGNFPVCRARGFDVVEIAGRNVNLFVSSQSLPISGKEMQQAKRIISTMIARNMQQDYQILDKEFGR